MKKIHMLFVLLGAAFFSVPPANAACPVDNPDCFCRTHPRDPECLPPPPPPPAWDGTVGGRWYADDGSLYYIRQIGNQVWWAGMSVNSTDGYLDFFKGLNFTNLFQGTISGRRITGTWADVPRGGNFGNGTLVLDVVPPSSGRPRPSLRKVSQTGGFGPSVWNFGSLPTPATECSPSPDILPPDIRCLFDKVKKNAGDTLLDNLKPEKDYVAIFGSVSPSGLLGVGFPITWPRTYANFLRSVGHWCDGSGCYDGGDDDTTFKFIVDRGALDNVPGFWTDGWRYPDDGPAVVRQKLNANNNVVEAELIMFGRSGANNPPLLPGWAEWNANSTLWNGFPINGNVGGIGGGPYGGCCGRGTIGGFRPTAYQRVRVSGVLSLDDDHGDNPAEIHPVYSVDVVQDWTRPRPNANLTGTWGGNDMSTFYIRQIGNTVWWLNLSRDQGRTFANVFVGTIGTETINGSSRQVINGNWADTPLGGTRSSGTLKLVGTRCVNGSCDVRSPIALHNRLGIWSGTGGFGGQSFEKLYDRATAPPPPPS